MPDSNPLAGMLPSMLVPTLDPKELEKRINDLKTVEHWLDMNRSLLHSTIQTLEMQRNALVAWQAMAQSAQSGAAAPGSDSVMASSAPPFNAPAGGEPSAAQPFNPALWWNALQQQFARLATAAATEPGREADPAPAAPEAPPGEPRSGQT